MSGSGLVVFFLVQGSIGFTSGHPGSRRSKGFVGCFCILWFSHAMGKRGFSGAPLKRPASYVPSNDGPLLSEVASSTFGHELPSSKEATAALQSIGDINHFRECARELGVPNRYRNAGGDWVKFFRSVLHDRGTKTPNNSTGFLRKGYVMWCTVLLSCTAGM